MEVIKNGTQQSIEGPKDWFTGSVTINPLFQKKPSTKAAGALVTFQPGARTAWHTHPAGQTLIVTSGSGWVQKEGGPKEDISSGDVVWFAPNEKHWHGASPNDTMSHIAVQEEVHGEVVTWMEHVSDEQYSK